MDKIICPKCDKELESVRVGGFNYDGSDTFYIVPLSFDTNGISFMVEGDKISSYYVDKDYHEGITCPYCATPLFTINNDIEVVEFEEVILSKE